MPVYMDQYAEKLYLQFPGLLTTIHVNDTAEVSLRAPFFNWIFTPDWLRLFGTVMLIQLYTHIEQIRSSSLN